MIKFKLLLFLLLPVLLLLPFVSAKPSFSQETSVSLYFFWAQGCPHCSREKEFLKDLQQKYPQINIQDYEITRSSENLNLLRAVSQKLNLEISSVPFTLVGEHYFIGFQSPETTGAAIEDAVNCALQSGCQDIIASLKKEKTIPEAIKIPFLGNLQIKNLSLPVLTLIIGLLDGFNPCAMWALLFLISLLLGMQDRKRMWALGTTFIVASAFVYFLFMAAWLNFLLFLGFVIWVRILIGLVALGAGGYNIRDYLVNPAGICKVSHGRQRQKILEKLKTFTSQKQFLLALLGIILLAFAVNLIELVCSAGLPAIYTQILTLSHLPLWQYYLYLLFYIFIFMLDDLFVFFAAMITLRAAGLEGKYARYSRLIGGILMLLIGILLLFKPELLMFS